MTNSELFSDRDTALEMLRTAIALEGNRRSCRKTEKAAAKKIRVKKARQQAQNGRRGPCQCGHCRACIDNARWDRVFNEKFLDVSYYDGLRLSARSPLSGF